MAKKLIKNASIVIDAYTLGNRANSVTIDASAEMVEVTGFGDANRVNLKSFTSWSVTVGFFDDFEDNQLNEKVFGWWQSTVPVTIAIRAEATAVSASNPEWTGNVWFTGGPLLTGAFGAASGGSLTLQGDGALSRNVS